MGKELYDSIKCNFYNDYIKHDQFAHNPYRSEAREGQKGQGTLYFLHYWAYSLDFTMELIYNKA